MILQYELVADHFGRLLLTACDDRTAERAGDADVQLLASRWQVYLQDHVGQKITVDSVRAMKARMMATARTMRDTGELYDDVDVEAFIEEPEPRRYIRRRC